MAPKKERPSSSDDDRRLFLEALGEIVRNESPVKKGPAVRSEPPPLKKQPSKEDFAELLGEFENHPDFVQKKRIENDASTKQAKPREPKDGIDAAIDLHASTLEMALRRTEEFLVRCHVKKFRRVLVIHGKGSGILRDGVRKYLEHHPYVAQLVPAGKQHGGDGAIVALLRR
jgi:DNA-nicking Smr family endonuclease